MMRQTRLKYAWVVSVLSVTLLMNGCVPSNPSKAPSNNSSNNATGNATQSTPGDNSTKVTGDKPGEIPDNPSGNLSKNAPDKNSHNTTGNVSQNVSSNVPGSNVTKPSSPEPLPVIASSSLKLVYADNFTSNKSGWPIGASGNLTYLYKDSGYHMSINLPGYVFPVKNNHVPQQTNFVAEIGARLLSSNGTNSSFGLVFQFDDKDDYYAFTIAGDRYSIWKHTGEDYSSVQPSTYSRYIKTDGSTNQLRVARLNKTIEVYVNGERLATVTDDSLYKGTIGLIVTDVASAVFADFKLYNFTDDYLSVAAPDLLPKIVKQNIGPAGGTVTANLSGNFQGTLQITVPKDTFTDTQAFQVTTQDALSPNADFYPGSPLVTITSPGGTFKNPVSIKITVKYAADEFPMVFEVDEAGNFEPVPTATLNQSTIGVSFYNFPKTIQIIVLVARKLPVKPLTDFTPGYDDWEFNNMPVYTSNQGICTGMSMTALYYFDEVGSIGKGLPLSGRYLGNNTDIVEDDRQAIRLASLVQVAYENSNAYHDNSFYYSANVPLIISSNVNGDTVTYRSFLAAMAITQQPQLVMMFGKDKSTGNVSGHCMIAYSCADGIVVADPNDPGGSHVIPFKNGKLGPYDTDPGEPKSGALYDTFTFVGKGGAYLPWSTIGDFWGKITDTTIGDNVFPKYNIKVLDDKGNLYADNIKDEDNVSVNRTKIYLLPAPSLNAFVLGIYQNDDFYSKVHPLVPANTTINLTAGDNLIGILVASINLTCDPEMTNALWTDFIWINIKCNPSETWRANLGGSSKLTPNTLTATMNHSFVVDFTLPGSLVDALNGKGFIYGKGIANGGTNVVSQAVTSTRYAGDMIVNGSINGLKVDVSAPSYDGKIWIFSENWNPITLYSYVLSGTTYQANGFKGFILSPKNVTDTTITGDWWTADISGYTQGGLSGTFTLTRAQ